ncbi:hypothetical protein BJ741DRAFT_561343 [Chytriomyces cf. hyalinus JEL632]|nr:hypothetical protein BJ741DRAFT_561343 [Chytriomyces cf. hyalinus JEL632]
MNELSAQLDILRTRSENAEAAVVDIQSTVVRMQGVSKELAVSLLFDKQRGILSILKNTRESLSPKAKQLMFDFFVDLIRRQFVTTASANEMQSVCVTLFSHSKELAIVKKTAVFALISLVEAMLLDAPKVEAIAKHFVQAYILGESKIVSSVKSAILELLGALVRYYPDCFSTNGKMDPAQLKRRMMTAIATCIKSAEPDMELLAGAVLGLSNYMHSMPVTEAEASEVFATIRKMLIPLENQTRYAVPKAGMMFLQDHASKFHKQICSDRDSIMYLHTCLKQMCKHTNKDISKLGYGAMTAFLQEVTIALSEQELETVQLELFWYFVKDFVAIVNSSDGSYKSLAQGVRGLGLFAKPCKVLLSENELKELLSILIKKLASLAEGSNDAKYSHISAFLDAFKMIACEMTVIESDFMDAIEQVSVSALLNFSKIRSYYRDPMVASFVQLLWQLNKHELLISFWNRVAKQLFVISCIVESPVNENADELASEAREPSWKEYVQFWEALFLKAEESWDSESTERFHAVLYDGIIDCVLNIPSDLNLHVREHSGPGDDSPSSNIVSIASDTSKLVPENPSDFIVFVNFVSLSETILSKIRASLFLKWVFVVGQRVISYSSQHPLVSGFYKLFGSVLLLCEKLCFFAKTNERDAMDVDRPESNANQLCQELFSKYLSEVLLKMRQFKDDLLVSCLKMVLASPSELTSIANLCLPIVESLKMGLSYTPLAVVALDAMESWRTKTESKVMLKAYEKILPSFHDYLILDFEAEQGIAASNSTKTSAKRSFGRRKNLKDNLHLDEETVENLKGIQIRILKFLGSLGDANKLMLSSDTSDSLLAWDSERCLKFQIPFKETIVDIYFDDMLPRIVELAEFSPDRKTKVAANELLHALVIIMVGGSQANRSGNELRSPYHKIYIKVFPVLLRLSVDLDKVTRELFRPLVSQLIHWFTKNSKYENPETMALLQSCFDAVASISGPLREFGAECIAEYLKWSIKHASEKELENNPMNAKSLFKRIYSLCQHSSASKRMSASIIVNRIYTVFRESAVLVDMFSFELLYHLLFSLKVADSDNAALGTIVLAKTAVNSIGKIIAVKSDVFLKKSNARRLPPGIECPDLQSLTLWLFRESRHRELEYSYKCIELFDKFASKTTGAAAWVKSLKAKNSEYVIDMIESDSALKPPAGPIDNRNIRQWNIFSANLKVALIVYRYLIDRTAITALEFSATSSSQLLEAVKAFLEIAITFDAATWQGSPSELNSLCTENAFVVLKIVEFVHSMLLKSEGASVLGDTLQLPIFSQMLGLLVFEPPTLGFLTAVEETRIEVENRVSELISTVWKTASSVRINIAKEWARKLSILDFTVMGQGIKKSALLDAIRGLKLLHRAKVIDEVFKESEFLRESFLERMFQNAIELLKGTDLIQTRLAGEIVSFCLMDPVFQRKAWKLALGAEDFKTVHDKIFGVFNRSICLNVTSFASAVKEGIPRARLVTVVVGLLDWLSSKKTTAAKEIALFSAQVSIDEAMLNEISAAFQENSEDELIKFWMRLLMLNPNLLSGTSSHSMNPFWHEFFAQFNHRSPLSKLRNIFEILSYVTASSRSDQIAAALSDIVTEKFPLGNETAEEIEKLDDYVISMNRLLSAMESAVGSSVIENALLFHLSRDANHYFKFSFIDALSKKIPRVTAEVFDEICAHSFQRILSNDYPADIRRNIAHIMLTPALQSGDVENVIRFFVQNIKPIMEVLGGNTGPDTDESVKRYLTCKSICFSLMEIAYKRIPSSELHSSTGRVLKAFIGEGKIGEKEITVSLIKAAMDFKKKMPSESQELQSHRILANQSAYNATASCLLATQNITKVEIFNSYLFVEKPCLWENIIDTENKVFLKTDLDKPFIRMGIKEFSESTVLAGRTRKYISTQFLADSSLSQMGTLFQKRDAPLSLSTSQKSLSSLSLGSQGEITGPLIDAESNGTLDNGRAEIELDVVNSNPCMKAMLLIISKLPAVASGSEMPTWMKSLISKIQKQETHINVKLFIGKLIINAPNIFEAQKNQWWRFLMMLIADGDHFGEGINYFIQDLCMLLMEWNKDGALAEAHDQDLILKSMRWLIRHCNHESKSVIRNHLKIIRIFVEQFKPFVIAPSDVLYDYLRIKADPASKQQKYLNLSGIYALQTFLANEISAYDHRGLTDRVFSESDLYDAIRQLLGSAKTKEIYAPAAECLGALLGYLQKFNSPLLIEFQQKVDDTLKKLSAFDQKIYVIAVNRLSVGFPRILQTQHKLILNMFPKLDLMAKAKGLEALLSYADCIPDLFIEMLGLDLNSILRSQEEECQVYTLGILAVISPTLTSSQVEKFLPLATEIFLSHTSERCRAAFFSMVHKISKNAIFELLDYNLKVLVKHSLLKGISDPNGSIRSSLLDYFSDDIFKNATVFDRSYELMSTWYLPENEDSFLKCGVNFLMDACKLTPMYEQKIYDRALPDARFNDRNIVVDLSWSKNASMMPLFAATQDQLPGFSLQERSDFVRATQDMIWTPTQGKRVCSDFSRSEAIVLDVTPRSARTAFTLSVSEFDVGTLPSASTKPGVNRNSIRPLIARSYVTEKDSTFFAYNTERKKKENKDVQKFRQEALRRSVTLYRSYREGELPDIEIKFKDVLDPLQSLALCDNETAQQLFACILTKVIASSSPAEKASPEAVSKAIGEIFQKSTMYSAPAMASLLRLVHNSPDLLKHINPRLVARAASASFNSELGALILENGIQSGLISAEPKRAKMSNEFFKKSPPGWAQLASLYKGMKFQEVYQSIFESQISSNAITKEAISAELLGDFETAKEKFVEAISCASAEATDAEPGLWSTERLECMNTLGEWSLLGATVLSDIDNDLGKLWSTENEEVYLPLFVRSHLKLQGGRSIDGKHTVHSSSHTETPFLVCSGVFVPWSDADPNPLTTFLKQSRNDAQRIGLLESTFTPELATISMLDGDMNLSHHFVDQAWKRIISQYSQLNSRTLVPKLQTLAKLQTNLELGEFCAFTQLAKAGSLTQSDVKTLFDNWRFRYPALSDPIGVWDDIVVSRKWMIEKSNGYLSADTPMGDAFRGVASLDDALYSRRMAAAATAQKLFTVADRWLDSANINPGTFEPAFMIQYYELQLGKVEFSREFGAKFEIQKNLMQHMEYYKKSIRDTDELCQSKFITLETRLLSSLLATATNLQPADSFFANLGSIKSVTKFAGRRVNTKPELFQLFLSRAKQSLMNLHSLQIDSESFQKGLINIGMFVDATLRASELDGSVKEELGKQSESARLIMTSILRAMAMGSFEAIEFFPRLLQLLSEYPELHQDCIKLLDDCPCWMFLRWLPQLTAQLDKSSGSVLLPLISRIAKRFPNALRYPLSISCEQYSFSSEMSRNEQAVEQIKRIVQSDSYDRLALELRRLEDPVHVFKDLCDRFESLIGSSLPTKKVAMKQAYAEFKQICLEQRQAGLLIKKFAEKHTTKIATICGSGDTLDAKKLKELVSYRDKFGAEAESKPGQNLLKSFSVWLDEYQSANVDAASQLEIPGQYTGDFDHNPEDHVKISSFDANVLVMSSMRRPKKIVMLGTDEKEYPWLVKGGEDLRLDQRIEQMFGIMNELMLRNPYCARNRISLATYKVIPMSTSLGIIEWVDGTKPLKSCLSESPLFEKRFQDSLTAYGEFVQRHGKSGQSFVASYDLFLQTASSKNVIDNIRSIWNKNRDSYLREFFIKLTRSPEAFFHIRSEFANSLSALNICSYFLGIGDRHLDNFLVDLKSGRIVGIDFGHAFGSATEVLPVPELVPFRLTDQMDKFLQPLGVKSLIVHPMTSVLSSIQDGKNRLLNALNIFVNEPLIEWRKFAVKQMQKQGKSAVALDSMSDSLSAPEWYPQQKLEFARRKLDGENPAYITADELEIGHGKKKFFRQVKAACMGDKTNNVRARVGRVCATPREQVDCLVDLAMDPNVLGRAWVGWSPFM